MHHSKETLDTGNPILITCSILINRILDNPELMTTATGTHHFVPIRATRTF